MAVWNAARGFEALAHGDVVVLVGEGVGARDVHVPELRVRQPREHLLRSEVNNFEK